MISEAALKEHRIANAFGTQASRCKDFAPIISQMIDKLGVTELLDYGCGHGELISHLKPSHPVTFQLYDPAVEEYSGEPVPMQMVVCVDVIEHVENEFRGKVLDDLKRVTGGVIFLATTDSDFSSWLDDLMDRFELQTLQVLPEGFYVIAYAKEIPLVEMPEEKLT